MEGNENPNTVRRERAVRPVRRRTDGNVPVSSSSGTAAGNGTARRRSPSYEKEGEGKERQTPSSYRSGEEGTEKRSSSDAGRRPSGSSGAEGRRRRSSSGGTGAEGERRRQASSGRTGGEEARRRRSGSDGAGAEGTRRRPDASGRAGGEEARRRRSGSGGAEAEGTRRRPDASGRTGGEEARRRRSGSGGAEGNSPRRRTNTSYNNEGKRAQREHTSYEQGEERPRRRPTASGSAERPARRRPSSSTNGEERESRNTERSRNRERYSDTERVRERRTRNSAKNSPDLTRLAVNPKVIGAAAAVLFIVIGVIVGVRSFGASHRTAENVVKELVKASVDGNSGSMKDAYGINGEVMVDMQEAFDATAAYYKAHNVKKTEIKTSGTLFEDGDYTYVYVLYNLLLDNEQEYPCIATYITQNVDGKYYVLTPAKVTEDLSAKATQSYQKFMTTDTYKNYTREYDTFIKKNPGYEEKIAAKLA